MSKQKKIITDIGLAQRPVNPSSPGYQETFYFDPTSAKQQASAITWADVSWNTHFGIWCAFPSSTGLQPIIRPNKPINGLVLTDIDMRMEGGRAYKVINPADNSLFDIREDQMLQAILKYGIQPGGLIGGEWVWGYNHVQIKCYLTDSTEYIDMLAANNITTHPVI